MSKLERRSRLVALQAQQHRSRNLLAFGRRAGDERLVREATRDLASLGRCARWLAQYAGVSA